MGDFNSHSTLWGCNSTNQNGLEMETFLLQSNLCLLNNKCPTYLHPATGSLSSLDLAFCDPSLYMNYAWSVHDDLCGSDHYPTMLSKLISEAADDHKRWKLNRADWEKFEKLCSINLQHSVITQSDDPFNQFTTNLLDIAINTIPKTCGKIKIRQKPWFNDDCNSAIVNRKSGLATFIKHPTEANLENIKILRAKARRIIRKSKRDSWRAYMSKLTTSTPAKKVWEMVKRISGKSAPGTARHLVVDDGKKN